MEKGYIILEPITEQYKKTDTVIIVTAIVVEEDIGKFLLTYEVKYVIVGVQEYRFGNPDVLASFGDHPALVKVFENGKNAIYNVDEDALWTSVNS